MSTENPFENPTTIDSPAAPKRRSMLRFSIWLFVAGVMVNVAAFFYFMAFVGIPDQAPTPAERKTQLFHEYVFGRIGFGAMILTALGFIATVLALLQRAFVRFRGTSTEAQA